jgi:hypothetical protein
MLVDECNRLYGGKPGDDATACVLRIRKREPMNMLFGPPANRDDADRMMSLFFSKEGKHIICGGTTSSIAAKYLGDMKTSGVDTLVLGCTHYPYLQKVIGEVMGDDIVLVNSALEVAKSVRDEISKHGLSASVDKVGKVSYFTSDSVDKFAALGSVFLGEEMKDVTKIAIDKEWDGGAFGEN